MHKVFSCFVFGLAFDLLYSIAEDLAMSQSFMSPLQTITLESLVALEQWAAVQASSRRKTGTRTKTEFPKNNLRRESNPRKNEN